MRVRLILSVAMVALGLAIFSPPSYAQVVAAEVQVVAAEVPVVAAPATSVETSDALQTAIAAFAGMAMSGDQATGEVLRLEAALTDARTRADSAVENVSASASTVHGAYESHITTLEREHASEIADLRAAQIDYQ